MKKNFAVLPLALGACLFATSCGFGNKEKNEADTGDSLTEKEAEAVVENPTDTIEYFGDDWYEAEKLEREIVGTWTYYGDHEAGLNNTSQNSSYKLVLKKNGKVVYSTHSESNQADMTLTMTFGGDYVIMDNRVILVLERDKSSFEWGGDFDNGEERPTEEQLRYGFFGRSSISEQVQFDVQELNGKTVLVLGGDKTFTKIR